MTSPAMPESRSDIDRYHTIRHTGIALQYPVSAFYGEMMQTWVYEE